MGDLAVNQKYADSWRLDHPDFGDVRGTIYAKGVIKEVQKLQNDPIKVASLVKVEIEGKGVSDFIPLFYHPKKQYWDNAEQGIKATDFNQAGKYFERAWMSFRASDEVRVMIREDKPYTVVGFYDGKPRIGENIIHFKIGNQYWWNCEKTEQYADGNGPDGKLLNLLRPCERILIKENTTTYQGNYSSVLHSEQYFRLTDEHTEHHVGELIISDNLVATITPYLRGTIEANRMKITKTIYRYLMPVGPILYLLETLSTQETITYSTEAFDNPDQSHPPFNELSYSIYYKDLVTGIEQYFPEEITRFNNYLNDQWLSQVFVEADNPPGENSETNYTSIDSSPELLGIFAALYTKELYDKAKSGGNIPSEFVKQNGFQAIFAQSSLFFDLYGINKPDLQVYVRPHDPGEVR